jgi:hypothetical protein
MSYTEDLSQECQEVALNTNEVMPDYLFYLKMYTAHQKMDFENSSND